MEDQAPHILFAISEDWVFYSHRLHLAERALQLGYEVTVLCNVNDSKLSLKNRGFKVIHWGLKRGSKNPFIVLKNVLSTLAVLKSSKPTIIHVVAMKPILTVGLANVFFEAQKVLYCVTGLGSVYTIDTARSKILRVLLKFSLRQIFKQKNSTVVTQNQDDFFFVKNTLGVPSTKLALVQGAGVNTLKFKKTEEPKGLPVIILPARMLKDKGVREFVELSKLINKTKKVARFKLIGDVDSENPNSISKADLVFWRKQGFIEWDGHSVKVEFELERCHIVCFPSYREGLPKALLEAGSCGKPVLAFDVPGCRDVIIHGHNGLLSPFLDIMDMYKNLLSLIDEPLLRFRFGDNARRLVCRNYSEKVVQDKFVKLWRN